MLLIQVPFGLIQSQSYSPLQQQMEEVEQRCRPAEFLPEFLRRPQAFLYHRPDLEPKAEEELRSRLQVLVRMREGPSLFR